MALHAMATSSSSHVIATAIGGYKNQYSTDAEPGFLTSYIVYSTGILCKFSTLVYWSPSAHWIELVQKSWIGVLRVQSIVGGLPSFCPPWIKETSEINSLHPFDHWGSVCVPRLPEVFYVITWLHNFAASHVAFRPSSATLLLLRMYCKLRIISPWCIISPPHSSTRRADVYAGSLMGLLMESIHEILLSVSLCIILIIIVIGCQYIKFCYPCVCVGVLFTWCHFITTKLVSPNSVHGIKGQWAR